MNAATLDDLRPRRRDRISRGVALALVVHAVLLVGLSLNVSWRSSEPVGGEAELWAAVPQVAAPRAVEPDPPKPMPVPPPEPPKPAPRVETPPPPSRDADIAREKREEREKLLDKQRLDDDRKARAQKEQERKAAERKQELAKTEALQREADKREAEKQKRLDTERSARIEAQRAENLKRIQGEAGATGAPGSTGAAAQSAGPSASYAGRIKARIKPNVVFTDEVPGNPLATVEVRLAPDGTIIGRRLVKGSGVKAWDDAVLRAIDKTEVLPRDTDGRVPASFEIDFRPRDL